MKRVSFVDGFKTPLKRLVTPNDSEVSPATQPRKRTVPTSPGTSQVGPRGLSNDTGATCYINATLAVLLRTLDVQAMIMDLEPDALDASPLLCQLRRLCLQLMSETRTTINTSEFVKVVNSLQSANVCCCSVDASKYA
jgi:hypothetical protein